MMMGTQLCSSRFLSLPRDESGNEELSVLPRHTKVIITGNNRTKSVLVGLQGVVKKAVGLGGWHWLIFLAKQALKNGVEVKLQRNALSVLEAPTGNEDDNDIDGNNSFCSSSDMGEKDMDYSSIEYHKPTKPRVRHTRPWSSCAKSSKQGNCHSSSKQQAVVPSSFRANVTLGSRGMGHGLVGFVVVTGTSAGSPNASSIHACPRVNLTKLGTPTLWRYWKHFNLVSMNPNPSKEELFHGAQQHFQSQQQLDESQVILDFIHTAKRLKTLYNS
ncbi:hypothetical protein ACP70R_012066 [Stipagrostis hirtigluma subsp. patula]